VKSYDIESVARELASIIKNTAEILTVQNGLQAYDLLKKNVKNPDRVFAGVVYPGSTRINNCSVSVDTISRAVVDAKATVLVEVLQASRFEFEQTNEIKQAIRDKMVINVALNAL